MACDFIGWCALDASEQAAWAQAVFSVIGIAVAIYVPARMARHDRKRRVNAIVGLMLSTWQAMRRYRESWPQDVLHSRELPTRPSDLFALLDSIEAIPLSDLPDAALIFPLVDFGQAVRGFVELMGEGRQANGLGEAERLVQLAWKHFEIAHRFQLYRFGTPYYRWKSRRARKLAERIAKSRG